MRERTEDPRRREDHHHPGGAGRRRGGQGLRVGGMAFANALTSHGLTSSRKPACYASSSTTSGGMPKPDASTHPSLSVSRCSLRAAPPARAPKVAQTSPPPVPAPAVARPAARARQDPVARRCIAAADRHFETGQQELALGHLARARHEFNHAARRAARVAGGRPRRRRASASISIAWSTASPRSKLQALATGDGFTETRTEPASIDQLLAIATFDTAAAAAATEEAVHSRPRGDLPRHPDSRQRPGAALRRAVPGPAARVPAAKGCSAARSTCR